MEKLTRSGLKIHPVYELVFNANPACSLRNCHGRGVWAASWAENQSPIGSGLYWPEHFHEEDICECVCPHGGGYWNSGETYYDPELCNEMVETVAMGGRPLSWYEMAHWGCFQCKVNELEEARADDAMAQMYESEKERADELEMERDNADRNRNFRA